LGDLPVDYTPTLVVLLTVVFFWLNHCSLHNDIGLTLTLSRIKQSINMSSLDTKKDINDDTAVPDADQSLSLLHGTPT
jgi:hypothetical protein